MGTYVGYIGVDGLHPTPEGYTKIAEIWRDAIQAAYEQPAAPAAHVDAGTDRLPTPAVVDQTYRFTPKRSTRPDGL